MARDPRACQRTLRVVMGRVAETGSSDMQAASCFKIRDDHGRAIGACGGRRGVVVSNTATISATELDPDPSNNSSTAAVALQAARAIPTPSKAFLMLLAAIVALVDAM